MAFMCCSVTTDNVLLKFRMFGRKKELYRPKGFQVSPW